MTTLTRTQDEIVARINSIGDDLFGFRKAVLYEHLDADRLTPYLKADAKLDDWEPSPATREAVLVELVSYLGFAWGKALDHRGLSASRSIEKLGELLWLMGPAADDVTADYDRADYPQYGAPKLAIISGFLEQALPGDDGSPTRAMAENMAAGRQCRHGLEGLHMGECDEGCGT